MPTGTYRHFQIQFPSSNTISYKVSSLAFPRSKLVSALRHFLRLIASVYAVLALLFKAHVEGLTLAYTGHDLDTLVTYVSRYSVIGNFLTSITESFNWWLLSLLSVLTILFCLRRDYTEESLLVLQGLGIQTSTSSPYWFLAPTTTFIPTTQIQDIVIHEAFKGFGIRFYLAVIVEGAAEVVVVFPNLLPRRPILEEVWRGSRRCLYGTAG